MHSVLEKIRIKFIKKETNFKSNKAKVLEFAQKKPMTRTDSETIHIINYLRFYHHFKDITDETILVDIIKKSIYKFVEKDNFIFYQGQEPDFYYIILHGMVGCGLISTNTLTGKYFGDEMEDVVYLKTGTAFGEMGILENWKRTRTTKAIKDCHFILISKEGCLKIFNLIPRSIKSGIHEAVNQMQIFSGFPPNKKKQLSMMCHLQSFRINEVVVQQGVNSKSIFFLRSGTLQKFRIMEKSDVSVRLLEKHKNYLKFVKFPLKVFVSTICYLNRCRFCIWTHRIPT